MWIWIVAAYIILIGLAIRIKKLRAMAIGVILFMTCMLISLAITGV